MLVSTQKAVILEATIHEHVAKFHASMATKRIVDIYTRHLFYNTTANFGSADVHLPKPEG